MREYYDDFDFYDDTDYAEKHFGSAFKQYDLAKAYKKMNFFHKLAFRYKAMFSSEKEDYKAALRKVKEDKKHHRKNQAKDRQSKLQLHLAIIQSKRAHRKSKRQREKTLEKMRKQRR